MVTLYKHKNNTDVAFEIVKRFYVKEKDLYKIKVCWWNVVPSHKPYCMNIFQTIKIPRTVYYSDWEMMEVHEWQSI
jgi:hypothetical protein